MSRRNRNNNRYNSRNRNKWDEGYEDDYFDEDDSSDQQDEYDQSEYEDEEYEEDESEEEEYDEDEYDEEEYEDEEDESDEEYDEDDSEDEEYDEDEYDEEEYEDEEEEDESDDEEYDEDESDDEDVEEEEVDEEDEDEDDELESEINAATESTAKKNLGNSDLLSKLRGQMRPQIKEDAEDSNSDKDNDLNINVSPLSLFGQPIGKGGKKDDATTPSSAPPQHANAKIVQTTVNAKTSTPSMAGSMHKAASGRVITAQSVNGASVSSVQPRDLEAEKAEADRKQKEKELLEQEQKEKEEKSARVLDKFKGKKTPTGESAVKKTKAGFAWLWSGVVWTWSKFASGVAWTWSKIVSGGAWIWAGIAACFLWLFWSQPKHIWQTWRIFNRSWWSGIGSGAWNALKYPFVGKPAAVTEEGSADRVGSQLEAGSAENGSFGDNTSSTRPCGFAHGSTPNPDEASASPDSVPVTASGRKRSRKKTVAAPVTDPAVSPTAPIASKEPESRRRLFTSLTSIGAAAVVFLLVLPSLMTGSRKNDDNSVALNEQGNVAQTSETNDANSGSNSVTSSSTSSSRNAASDSRFQNVKNTDRVGSQVDAGSAEKSSIEGNTSSTRPSGFAPDRVGSRVDAGSAENRSFGDNTPSNRPRGASSSPNSGIQNMGSAVPNDNASRNSYPPSARNNPGAYDNQRNPGAFDNQRNPGAYNNPRNPGAYDNSQPTAPSAYPNRTVPPTGRNSGYGITPPAVTTPELPAAELTPPELPAAELTPPELPVAELTPPELPAPAVPELDMTVPEMPAPEVTILDAPELDTTAQELSTPDVPSMDAPEVDLTVPETTANAAAALDENLADVPVPELPTDDAAQPEYVPTSVPSQEAPDRVGSQVDAGSAEKSSIEGNTSSTRPRGFAPDDSTVQDNAPIEIPIPELPTDDAPVQEDASADVSVPEIPEPELVNAEDPTDALSTPDDQNADTNNASDPFNVGASDVPEDSTVDLTAPEADKADEAPVVDEPDVPMPELPTEPVDSTPIDVPSIPEPTVPEPAIEEPTPIETGIASQPTEPALSEPALTPESNVPDNSQLASSSPELPTTPQATGVELGTPGPLVSSNASSTAPQKQEVAKANSNVNVSTPSTTPDYGTSYSNGYVYNSSGVYIVQPNDSFWTIAKRVYGSGEYARALVQYNSSRVNPESLTVSTQIMTPPPETLEQQYPGLCPARSSSSAASQPGGAAQPNTRVYVVDQEESVMEIVRRELGSVLYCSQVYALNQDQLSGSVDRVKPGVRLLLPVKK